MIEDDLSKKRKVHIKAKVIIGQKGEYRLMTPISYWLLFPDLCLLKTINNYYEHATTTTSKLNIQSLTFTLHHINRF